MTSIDKELKIKAKEKRLILSELLEEAIKYRLVIENEPVKLKCHFCGSDTHLQWVGYGNFSGYMCEKCWKKENEILKHTLNE